MNVLEVTVTTEPINTGAFRIYPIGDPHIDNLKCDRDRLKAYINLIADDPHALWVCVGDFVDGTTPSHRFFREVKAIRPDVLNNMSEYVSYTLLECEKVFEPLKGTHGVILQGNHDIRKGGTLWSGFAWEMSRRLEVQYGGDECLVRLRADTPSDSRGAVVWVVHAHHGAGGGILPGGRLNRMVRDTSRLTDADVMIRGHVHDSLPYITPVYSITRRGKPRLVERQRAYITAPGFVRNRVEGVTDYASQKAYPPTDEGLVYLECCNPPTQGTTKDRRMRRIEAPF